MNVNGVGPPDTTPLRGSVPHYDRELVAATVIYLLLTALLFFNLLPHLTTHVYSDAGDPVLNAAILGWNAKTLPLTDAWWNFPAFAPLAGITAFTEHLLVTYPVATPIVWLTANPGLAYNVVFLLAFALNAVAAFALARELIGSAAAAFIAGLAFAFAPYQAAHLSHLQMLVAFGMPLALLGLHRYVEAGRNGGLVLFAIGWLTTAFSNAYMLLFFPGLVMLWCGWFVRPHQWRRLLIVVATAIVVTTAVIPLMWGYYVRQAAYGLSRAYIEIRGLSADITGLSAVTHRAAVWRQWLPQVYDEIALFPGLGILVLAVAGLMVHLSGRVASRNRWAPILAAAGVLCVVIVLLRTWSGAEGWQIASMPLPRVTPFRLVTIAVVLLMGAMFATRRFRAAWLRRDAAVFYMVGAGAMWLVTLGPEPTWAGVRALTYGPYRLLLELPAAQSIRAPARAWIAGALCLAIVAGFGAAATIGRWPRQRRLLVPLLALPILAEGWFREPVAPLPPQGSLIIPREALVLELPFGDPFADTAAEYLAVLGGYRVLNGYSGYDAPQYGRLRESISEHRDEVLDAYRQRGDVYVILHGTVQDADARWVIQQAGSQLVSRERGRDIYRLGYLGSGTPPSLPLPLSASTSFAIP